MPTNSPLVPAAGPGPDVHEGIEEYVRHLQELEEVFNRQADEIDLGVSIDVRSAINAAREGTSLADIASFFDREDDSGVLHPEQLSTALSCVVNMVENPQQNGIVLGAMQSGKTTTSLAMQFAGPIIYAITGRRPYPIYLATSQTGQQDQTNIELTHFLSYYKLVRIVRDEGVNLPPGVSLDPLFLRSPTIEYYRSRVLRNALGDIHLGPRLEDFVTRRVHGQSIQAIADLCRRAHQEGFEPLLLIDEPQYGASDRMVINEAGDEERRPCVLLQIFQAIDEAVGGDAHSFVGLSATPYDTHELESVWVIRQRLTTAYRGFNYFGGRYISDGVQVEPPQTLGFSEFAREFQLPFFANISLGAYDGTPALFNRFARRIGFRGDQREYQAQVQASIRAAILAIIARAEGPVGICLRLFNNNARAQDFVRQLNLEGEGIEVLNYFGSEYTGISVKRAIRDRRHRDRPFVIVVTNRARMGDAFPGQVRWFFDFAKRASDLNSLLQGLLGRACGYNKQSTVVLSDDNARIVSDYRRTLGGYIYPTSRHSIVVGGFRRGAPTSLIRLRSDMEDPLVRQFFERIQAQVVEGTVLQGRQRLTTTRNRGGGFRTGPILRIAEELGLFAHLERADVSERLFPTIPGGFRIARAQDAVAHGRDPNRFLRYTLDQNGDCRFTFRWSNGDGSHVGVSSRGYGARDATDRARAADNLEPQIHMEKYDLATGEAFFDKDEAQQRPGDWRAYMMTLPLLEPVRELQAGLASLPNERNVHRSLMTDEEEDLAGFDE
jgi:hypothetical protein